MQRTIAFIGGGNMAASLIGGLLKSGVAAAHLRVVEPDAQRRQWLRQSFGVEASAASADMVPGCQALVLAVKPQAMAEALRDLKPDAGCAVISIAAGVRLATIARVLGDKLHYIRTMPNTPALYGAGVTGLYAPAGTPASARDAAETILAAVGTTVWLSREEDLDAVTALSGSGPAYYFLLTEMLREAGEALGLSHEAASTLAKQTCVGAGRMVAEARVDVEALRAQVTSKGGTTEAALAHLETSGVRAIFRDALRKAAGRAAEMGQALDADIK
jgi:pyrroline-5-carboxylate reductase